MECLEELCNTFFTKVVDKDFSKDKSWKPIIDLKSMDLDIIGFELNSLKKKEEGGEQFYLKSFLYLMVNEFYNSALEVAKENNYPSHLLTYVATKSIKP